MKMSSFAIHNAIQFFAAINENLYKLLAAYFLISLLGKGETDSIMSIVGALFIVPFLLFSNVGGVLADRFAKNRIVAMTRFLELVCLLVALPIFYTDHHPYGPYIILLLMATLSAIFGPAKYAILPELVQPEKILYANSMIVAYTYFGIIIGTALASFAVWFTGGDYAASLLFSVAFALAGLCLSLFLPKTPVENKTKRFPLFLYSEVIDTLKQMASIPTLLRSCLIYAYFLFLGAFVQLNIIPYAEQTLRLSDLAGGYLFLVTAVGLGIGAFSIHIWSGEQINLKIVSPAAYGISAVLILTYFFYHPWWLAVIWMFLLGFLGGVFLVPLQAQIIALSPDADRGRNFATTNFLSFCFALLASLALYLLNTLLGLPPQLSFAAIGVVNGVVVYLLDPQR